MHWLSDSSPFCYFPEYFNPSLKPVDFDVNVEKYMGDWFEQARKPTRFQVGCVDTKAHYELKPDKSVSVTNECITKSGAIRKVTGFANSTRPSNSTLKVYFNKYVGGSYWILHVDPEYQWAVVGEPCRKMSWVLSRNKDVPREKVVEMIQKLKNKGFDTSDMIFRGESDM